MGELSEMEMRILSELEEAGEENFPTIANTVTQVSGEDAERAQIKESLENLVHSELVIVSVLRGSPAAWEELPKEDSLAILAGIEQHLQFKSDSKHWTGGERPWPEIVSTDAGDKKAEEILEERGYQWWRREEKSEVEESGN